MRSALKPLTIIYARGERRNAMKSINKLCLLLMAVAALRSWPAIAQEVAPAWDLPSTYGTNIDSTNFTGKVVLLNFWATWCEPCCNEIPGLIALQKKYEPDGLTVVGISLDSSPDGINPPTALLSSFALSNGVNYPVVMDSPANTVDSLYGSIEYGLGGIIEYIPNTFIIDRQNHIVATLVGEQIYETFEAYVVPLIYANLTVNLSVANGQAHISWPVTQTAFAVESTGDLSGGVWTLETAPLQTNGMNQFIDVPVGPSQRFFRLERQ
jgi:peroxiredoxin